MNDPIATSDHREGVRGSTPGQRPYGVAHLVNDLAHMGKDLANLLGDERMIPVCIERLLALQPRLTLTRPGDQEPDGVEDLGPLLGDAARHATEWIEMGRAIRTLFTDLIPPGEEDLFSLAREATVELIESEYFSAVHGISTWKEQAQCQARLARALRGLGQKGAEAAEEAGRQKWAESLSEEHREIFLHGTQLQRNALVLEQQLAAMKKEQERDQSLVKRP